MKYFLKLRSYVILSILLILMLGIFHGQERSNDFPVLKGPYLGQKSPGLDAEVFAPGIICTQNHETMCGFFNNGTFLIYRSIPTDFDNSADSPIPIYITELKEATWSKPRLTKNLGKPWFYNLHSVSQNETYYYAEWKRDENGERLDLDIYRQYKTKSGWSDPEKLRFPVNTDKFDSWPSLSKNGTLYFFSGRDGGVGKTDIYKSELMNGEHETIENLGNSVNSEDHDHDPFIDPEERYLIFCSLRKGGFGEDDLYISFKTNENSWSKAYNMGSNINSEYPDNRPYMTPDGKYLFFIRVLNGNADIYWVDAKIIDELKPEELRLKR